MRQALAALATVLATIRHVEPVGASGWKRHESRSNGQPVPAPTTPSTM
jgi:hypothetical protein